VEAGNDGRLDRLRVVGQVADEVAVVLALGCRVGVLLARRGPPHEAAVGQPGPRHGFDHAVVVGLVVVGVGALRVHLVARDERLGLVVVRVRLGCRLGAGALLEELPVQQLVPRHVALARLDQAAVARADAWPPPLLCGCVVCLRQFYDNVIELGLCSDDLVGRACRPAAGAGGFE